MNWSTPAFYDHVARLERAGLVRRAPMTRGSGSLIVITPDGARMTAGPGAGAPRSVAPTTWAHVSACAWAAAWFAVRGREWLSSHEILREDTWAGDVVYHDGYGRRQRQRHRPDLVTYLPESGRPAAVEVELQPKSPARLRGILAMYHVRTAEPDPELAGVVYISGAIRVSRSLRSAAEAVNFGEYPDGRLRIFDLEDVIAETRAVAHSNRTTARESGSRDIHAVA